MCAKQVFQSFFTSRIAWQPPYSRLSRCVHALLRAGNLFSADKHTRLSTGLPPHAYSLRLTYVEDFRVSQCRPHLRCCCTCNSVGVSRYCIINTPDAGDAGSDTQCTKHCLPYEASTNESFFKIIDKPDVHSLIHRGLLVYPTVHNGKHEWRRYLSMLAWDAELPNAKCTTQTTEIHTSNPDELSSVSKRKHDVENAIMLRQADALLETDIADNREELKHNDIMEESTDDEKEFYNLIEAEDSPEELLSMLLGLEQTFPSCDPRVCRTCLRLAILCNDTDGNPEKILDYARKAFHNFDSSKFPLESARSLFLVGIAHYKMEEPDQAITSLERCVLMMDKPGGLSANQQGLAALQYNVRTVLGQAKISSGWLREGLLDIEKGLKIMEKRLPPESPRLAAYYRQTAEAYLRANKPMDALSLCKKALSISLISCGRSSSEVAELRSFMSQVYHELNDYENALCEAELAGPVLEKVGKVDEAISLCLESMQAFLSLGKFHDAVIKLKEIISKTEAENPLHVEALILLVKAFNGLKDDLSAGEFCQKALNILRMKNLTFESAKTLVRLSVAYGQLQNYNQALSVGKQALEFLKHCTEKEAAAVAADAEGYVGLLLLSIGRPSEAILHLERSITKKRSLYGSESVEILNVCNHLGVAYMHAAQVDEALAVFKAAKTVLNKSDNTGGLMSICIHDNLSITCSLLGKIDEAIDYKRHAINLMKKARKEHCYSSVEEEEEELEALIQAQRQNVPYESNDKVLRKMLTSCTRAHALI